MSPLRMVPVTKATSYDFNLFSDGDKRRYLETRFPQDLQKAYDLGKRLVEKAKE